MFWVIHIIKNQTGENKQWLSTQEIKAHKGEHSWTYTGYSSTNYSLGNGIIFASTTSGDLKAVFLQLMVSIIVFLFFCIMLAWPK